MAPSRELAICGVTAFVFIVCSLLAVGIPTYAGKTAVVIVEQCEFGSSYRVAVLNIIKPSQYYQFGTYRPILQRKLILTSLSC